MGIKHLSKSSMVRLIQGSIIFKTLKNWIDFAPGILSWLCQYEDLSDALNKIFNSAAPKSIFNLAYVRQVTLGTILKRLQIHLSTLNLVETTKVIYDNSMLNADLIPSTINWKPKHCIKLGIIKCNSVNTNKQLC